MYLLSHSLISQLYNLSEKSHSVQLFNLQNTEKLFVHEKIQPETDCKWCLLYRLMVDTKIVS